MPYVLTEQQKQWFAKRLRQGADAGALAHHVIRVWEVVDYGVPGEVERFVTTVTAYAAELEDCP